MAKRKKKVDEGTKMPEINPEEVAAVEAKEGEAKKEVKDLSPEEKEAMKEEISDAYCRKILFQMYRRQIIQACEYALERRMSLQAMKDEIAEKKSDLPSNARKFISEIDPTAFVKLAAMIRVDFSEDHANDPVVMVDKKEEKKEVEIPSVKAEETKEE